jgi:hypothetical protein
VWWQQRDWSVSRLASRQRTAILSDIIINENLKLLQINYFVWRADALFAELIARLFKNHKLKQVKMECRYNKPHSLYNTLLFIMFCFSL